MTMHYTRNDSNEVRGNTRMEPMPEITNGQLAGLPNGTEVLVISIEMFGMGVSKDIYEITDEFRESLYSPEKHEGCDHGLSREEIDASLFPGSIFVVLLPENYEPDINAAMLDRFIRRGDREGSEGAPMYSETGLRSRYNENDWIDGAYAAYEAAYKRAAERRKGR